MENIFLIGPMGAGKTTVGRLLAKQFKKKFYDSDAEIEKQMGVSLAWIVDLEGEPGLRQREAAVIAQLARLSGIVLSTGGGCVNSPRVRQCLWERGIIIYMQVSLEVQLRRLKDDKRRPLLRGDHPERTLARLWQERKPYYEQLANFAIYTDCRTARNVCREITARLQHSK